MSNTQKNLQLYEPKSRLAYADSMSQELLSEFNDNDIQLYRDEYSVLKTCQTEDITETQGVISEVLKGLKFMFGESSKQTKYIERALAKGETVCDTHYAKFAHPEQIKQGVASAKLKCNGQSTQVGLSETNVDDLNDAIGYLTEKGFVFGRDFTAHNAVDMAKALYLENCQCDSNLIRLQKNTPDCDGCEQEYSAGNVNTQGFTLSCRCYEERGLDIVFEDNAPVFGVVKYEE